MTNLPNEPSPAPRIPLVAQVSFDERRQSMRFPKESGTDFATLVHPAECEGVYEVADESLGGLAIVVDEPALFTSGLVVELVYAGGYSTAEVRHITRRPDGRFHIGLQCR